VKQNTHS